MHGLRTASATRSPICRRGLPKGVQLRIVYDQSELVGVALGGVGRAVLIGAVFVVLVLFVLLGNVRAALDRDAHPSRCRSRSPGLF